MDVFEQLLGKHGSVDARTSGPARAGEPTSVSDVYTDSNYRRRGRPATYNKLLSPMERRITMLHVGGASLDAIAMLLGVAQAHVRDVVTRPHVLSYIGFLEMTTASSIQPAVEKLNEAIETAAARAFVVASDNMEDLNEMGEELRDCDTKNSIRAKLGAVATAQDILDRAGKRAPTRIVGDVRHVVDADALSHLAKTIEVVAERKYDQKSIEEASEASIVGEGNGEARDVDVTPGSSSGSGESKS